MSESPINSLITESPATLTPSTVPGSANSAGDTQQSSPTPKPFQKPFSKPKPGGGKGPKPARTHSPVTLSDFHYVPLSTSKPTNTPTKASVTTSKPTDNPSSSPLSMIDNIIANPKTAPPSPGPTQPPSSLSTEQTIDSTPAPVDVQSEYKPSGADVALSDADNQSETENDGNNTSLDTEPVDTDTDTAAEPYVPVNEFDCSGEPCPVSTHCRSRYGSCGPGFIYW